MGGVVGGEDIISQGGNRPPGWRRPMLWIAAAAVVVALIVVEHFPHGAARARHPSAHGNVRAVAGSSFQVQVEGSAVPWAASARLPRTGSRPEWFWPATGRAVAIPGLPEDRHSYMFTRVIGGWAIQSDPGGQAGCFNCTSAGQPSGPSGCGDCTGAPSQVFFLADRAGPATMVRSASLVAPAAGAGTMWLTTFPAHADLSTTRGVAQQFTSTGAAVGGPVMLPAGYGIAQGTDQGLLLVSLSENGSANSDQLWDPITRRVLRNFDGVVAAGATEVAYEPPCRATCPVHVVNLRNRHDTVLELPIANTVTSARFSPDGRFLALEVSVGDSLDKLSVVKLDVASMQDGHVAVVPGTSVSSDAVMGFGWPGNRDDLVAVLSFSRGTLALSWDPAANTSAIAYIAPRQEPTALIVG